MLEDFLVNEAKRRKDIFVNIENYLKNIKQVLNSIDPNGRVFIFGSTARGDNVLSSDIDVLILTEFDPSFIISSLRRKGFDEVFEFHVIDSKRFKVYSSSIKDLKEV
ncbi:MAG: nucleotidyltransferase domain-containing protein [Nitrososphaeria archaeon]